MLYNILVHAHSGLRWLVLILLLVAIGASFRKWQGRDEYTNTDNRLYVWALVATHIQVTIGLVLYFLSPKVDFNLMSEKVYRFYSVEHITIMIIAAVLITIGRARSRRAPGPINKHKTVFIFYSLGLFLILAGIPWPFRIPGAGWF